MYIYVYMCVCVCVCVVLFFSNIKIYILTYHCKGIYIYMQYNLYMYTEIYTMSMIHRNIYICYFKKKQYSVTLG